METTPKLFKATTSADFAPNGIPSRTFTTKEDATDWLEAILEQWHTYMSLESNRHHVELDVRFWAVSIVVEE